METKTDDQQVLETAEVAEETTETPEVTAEEIAQLKAKAAKADELEGKNKQLFERLKKAEVKAPLQEVKSDGLSTKDVIFLAKADIHEDDVSEVLDWAKFKGVTVSEAHKQLKGVLADRSEQRKTAETTNISNARRSTVKVTDETILEKASKGDLPDSDEGIERLVKAKMKAR